MKHLISAAILAAALPVPPRRRPLSARGTRPVRRLRTTGSRWRTYPGPAGPNAFSWELNDGETKSFSLFRLFTDETHVNWGDDDVPQALSINFSVGGASGSVDGTTNGHNWLLKHWASVDWASPLTLDVGTGLLSILLCDLDFINKGWFGLDEGKYHGSDVTAKVSYTPAPVPLPAGFGLIAVAMGALGVARSRRKVGLRGKGPGRGACSDPAWLARGRFWSAP